MEERPDILVLGGGGRQGDAWMTGVIAGLEDAQGVSLATCDHFIGTSAGAIVATKLFTGRALRRPSERVGAAPNGQSPFPSWAANSAMAIAAPLASIGLRVATRPAELARVAALTIAVREDRERLNFRDAFPSRRTRFDGRLRVVAVDRRSGKRVVFGAPGAPHATIAQALSASCALPRVFAPAYIGGREYVDGAIWSPTNADVAPVGRDARVLILAPMASLYGPWNAPIRAACRATMLVEASALKARGAQVRMISPDRNSAASIGRDLMSDERLEDTHAVGYAQGLSL